MIDQSRSISPEKHLVSMAILVALGVILHRVEALLPLPSPWIKLGLANIMTLLALVFLGMKEALVVTVLRIVLSSILGGTFLAPTFFLSLVGGLAAAITMVLFYRAGTFSLVGVSVAASHAHIFAVVLCVYFLLIKHHEFLYLLPIFFTLAMISGIMTGTAANLLTQKLIKEDISLK